MSDNPLLDLLIKHEGASKDAQGRHLVYCDTQGKWTLGYGRNVSEVGASEEEAQQWLRNDVERVRCELDQACPWWRSMGEVRQAVLINMGFNLGVLTPPGKAKLLTFVNTLSHMRHGHYDKAADGMLASLWAKQVGRRATELATMMRTGQWPS